MEKVVGDPNIKDPIDGSDENDELIGDEEFLTLLQGFGALNFVMPGGKVHGLLTGLDGKAAPTAAVIQNGAAFEDDDSMVIDGGALLAEGSVTDVDMGDVHTVTALATASGVLFAYDNVSQLLTINPGQFEALAEGVQQAVTFTGTVTDNNGGSIDTDFDVVITGQNDAPASNDENLTEDGELGGRIEENLGLDGPIALFPSLLANASDPDLEGDSTLEELQEELDVVNITNAHFVDASGNSLGTSLSDSDLDGLEGISLLEISFDPDSAENSIIKIEAFDGIGRLIGTVTITIDPDTGNVSYDNPNNLWVSLNESENFSIAFNYQVEDSLGLTSDTSTATMDLVGLDKLSLFEPKNLLFNLEGEEAQLRGAREAFGLPDLDDNTISNSEDVMLWKDHEIGQPYAFTYSYDLNEWSIGALLEASFPGIDFQRLEATQKVLVDESLAIWSSIANVTFERLNNPDPFDPYRDPNLRDANPDGGVIVNDPVAGFPTISVTDELLPDIVFRDMVGGITLKIGGIANLTPDAEGFNPSPLPGIIPEGVINGGKVILPAADIGINFERLDFLNLPAVNTIVHEIGHALLLDHLGNPDNSPVADPLLLNIGGSIMESDGGESPLIDPPFNDIFQTLIPITPMILDIITIQFLYGQNTDHNSGDTVYMFDGRSISRGYDGITIWDGGGVDTINSFNFNNSVRIDLREGLEYFSHIGNQIIFNAAPFSYELETGEVISGVGANIENATAGIGDDVIIGNDLANTLDGGFNNDEIEGGGNNDKLYGGKGDDTLKGGEGCDTLYGQLNNDILFGDSGNDVLYGGEGDDVIDGGAGADIIDGGAGTNTASYITSGLAVHVDLRLAVQNDIGTDAHGDQFINIQNLEGSVHNDRLDGDQKNNVLSGNAGDDLMFGHQGEDYLKGGDGNDYLDGGTGDDTLNGQFGDDLIYGGNGDDILYGNLGADILHSGKGDDILRGGEGDDILDGGRGDNILDGGKGIDSVSFALNSKAVNIDLHNTIIEGRSENTLISIEGVVGTAFDDTLIGNDQDNVFEGGAGADTITGNGGENTLSYRSSDLAVQVDLESGSFLGGDAVGDIISDLANFHHLIGSKNGDTLVGDAKDNIIEGGSGADTITGNSGNDTLSYRSSNQAVNIDLGLGSFSGGDTVGDVITDLASFTNLIGSEKADTLIGNDQANDIQGLDGADLIVGGDGNDTLRGGEGPDLLDGGLGADTLFGGNDATDAGQYSVNGVWTIELVDSFFGGPIKVDSLTLTLTNADLEVFNFTSDLINNGQPFSETTVFSSLDILGFTGDLINVAITLNGVKTFESTVSPTPAIDYTEIESFNGLQLSITNNVGTTSEVLTGVYSGLSMNNNDITIDDINGVFTPTSRAPPIPDGTYATQSGDALLNLQNAITVGDTFGDWVLKIEDNDAFNQSGISSIAGWEIVIETDAGIFSASGAGFDSVNSGVALSIAHLSGVMGTTIENITVTMTGFESPFMQELIVSVVAPDTMSTEAELFKRVGFDPQPEITVTFDDKDSHVAFGSALIFGDHITSESGDGLLSLIPNFFDTVTYENSMASVRINLFNELQTSSGTEADGDRLIDIENVIGADVAGLGDHLIGNDKQNVLVGLEGDDVLQGLAGDDTLDGGIGADTLLGGIGDDILKGGNGNDTLKGGVGDDILAGGGGADTFSFDIGADVTIPFPLGIPPSPLGQGDFVNLAGIHFGDQTGDIDVIVDFSVAEGDSLQFVDTFLGGQLALFFGQNVEIAPGVSIQLNPEVHNADVVTADGAIGPDGLNDLVIEFDTDGNLFSNFIDDGGGGSIILSNTSFAEISADLGVDVNPDNFISVLAASGNIVFA